MLALTLTVVLCLTSAAPAAAVRLLRDADLEYGLYILSFPILRAAGLSPTRTRILVVDDDRLNAFVIDHSAIYLHSGLIQKVRSARVLQAVIAHEAAHISNGHIARRMTNLKSARTAAGLGLALAAVAAAAGGGEAAAGVGALTSSLAQRSFLAHTRAEESAADRSAAAYLKFAGVSPTGLIELHEAFQAQESLNINRKDPYSGSHPLTTDRIRAARDYVARYGDIGPTDPEFDYWFARIKGKLSAFKRAPKWTRRRVEGEISPDVRNMRLAVAWHRESNMAQALAALNRALALRPDDPYYLDLRGQILMENRRTDAAISAYRQAAELAPRNSLIQGSLGRALLADGQPRAALEPLERARSGDYRNAYVLRDLGQAYAHLGQDGMAALATAERFALQGEMTDAARHARRALALLPEGSAPWRRAEDVLVTAERMTKRK